MTAQKYTGKFTIYCHDEAIKIIQTFCELLFPEKFLKFIGDEPYNEVNKKYVQNCDWMLSEAYCLYDDREKFKPYQKHHSTALDAGKCADKLNIKNLLLYHTEDTDLEKRKKLYTDEAKSVFGGNVFVPYDLEKVIIK